MATSTSDDVYLLKRDKEESGRLDTQHKFLVGLSDNNAIHPSIPKDQICSVADIATGTGVWLQTVADTLSEQSPSSTPRYYHGFDISPAQFPTQQSTSTSTIHFSVQNILKPFPAEHLGRFDLVHVRLLVAGLLEGEYSTAVKNLESLLKPNGYLQWEEVDNVFDISSPGQHHPVLEEIYQVIFHGMNDTGMSFHASQQVYDESRAVGLKNVMMEVYTTENKEYLWPMARTWLGTLSRMLITRSLLRSGEALDENEAKERTDKIMERYERYCQEGNRPLASLKMVVGQKP